jgi:cell division protein FtsQ
MTGGPPAPGSPADRGGPPAAGRPPERGGPLNPGGPPDRDGQPDRGGPSDRGGLPDRGGAAAPGGQDFPASAVGVATEDPPEPAPQVTARRGRSRYKAAFFALGAAALIAAAVWVLFGSRLLVVRSIQVTGTHLVPKSEVLAAAGIPPGLPLMRLNTGAVASRVDRITQVQSARVTRSWPDGLVIAVQERKPALAVPVPGGFDLIDPSGVVVQQVSKQPRRLPQFIPVGPLAGNPGVRAAASVLRELPRAIARRVTSVTVPTLDAVTLHLPGGVTVDWGSPGLAAQKARVLAILMRTHAHSYDVSAPDSATTG